MTSVNGKARMSGRPDPRHREERLANARHGSITQHGRVYQPTSLEVQIEAILRKLGLRYAAQFPTRTGFVIDFAVWHDGRKIALEIDGPCHDTPRARKRDAFRTLKLKRGGWEVVRIHHSEMDRAEEIISEVLNDRS